MSKVKYACEQDILCGVNMAKDTKSLSELEKKHLPVIDAPARVDQNELFEIKVKVGGIDGIEHPNEPAHFIEWIELYSGDTFLFRVSLAGSLSQPKITIPVKLTHAHGPLKAWGKCNIHGLWESVKDIEVED